MTQDYIELLRVEVEREVMACIGCNDCMLACPLPEKQRVTIAELNAGVLDDRITSPNVINFVTACTQCQQCIPVCPANLHRADMVLWNKMKVETVAPNRAMPLQIGSHVVQSNWTLDTLAQQLGTFQLLQGVPVEHMRRMLLSCTLRQLAAGETLCREGEFHERLYIFLEGEIEQSVSTASGGHMRILVLGAGTFHGEMAVLGNHEEGYNLVALHQSTVLEVPKATVHRMMKELPGFKATMDELYRRRALWTYVVHSPLFRSIPEVALENMLQDATLRVFRAGEVVYREGEASGDLCLVQSGYLRVARKHYDSELVVQYYREGDIFGASSVLFNQPQPTTISANTRADVVFIPAASVLSMLDKYQDLRAGLIEEAYRNDQLLRLAMPQAKKDAVTQSIVGIQTIQQHISLSSLMDQGVMQGHEILVIDTAKCTNCNNCVDACGRRHGYSRIERRGLQMGNLLFPTACRHCEDPVCLLCSVNGIVRKPDGEISIVTESCIGCGACAERCPYGNIQMHERHKQPENLLLTMVKSLGLAKEEAKHSRDNIAVKCNLCEGYADYACVRGCPVGAAMRIDPVEQFKRDDLNVGLEMKKKVGNG
jgi:CRP-like cAMP-binding protein/Fe-S-cluster-containing hydrogenase component 2